MRGVVMAGDWGDESNLGGVAANNGGSMATQGNTVVSNLQRSKIGPLALSALLVMAIAAPAVAQVTRPVWYPPLSLYGRPVAQPYFDFPNWARYSNCRPAPLAWGYDPFPNYGPCEGSVDCLPETVACPGDFVAHRPSSWYFTADFAPLTMDRLDGVALARIGPSGPVVLSTEDLQTEFAAGGKYTIGRRIFDCYRLEGTYIGFHSWEDERLVVNSATNSLGGSGNLSTYFSGFSNPITAGLDGANFVSASVRSNFQSGEINVRYWGDMPPGPLDVSLLIGVRYIRIEDQFNFVSQADRPLPAGTTLDLQSNTLNDMWGAQIGIEFACLVSSRVWFDFDLKGGIFSDRVDLSTSALNNGASTLITDTRNRTAWLGDLSLIANWQMTPYWVLRAGYQALFFNGLSLAHEQNVSPIFPNVVGVLNDRGAAVYHGPILGIGANW